MRLIYLFLILLIIPISFAYDGLMSYTKIGSPTNLSDGTELNSTQYAQVNISDDDSMVSGLTGVNPLDSQIFIFNMSSSIFDISYLGNLNFTWEGFGDNNSGFYTNLSIWNWSNSGWYQLNSTDFLTSVDLVINVSISSGFTDFINSTTKEVGFLVSSRKNICGAGHTDGGEGNCTVTLRPDSAGDLTQFPTAIPDVAHYLNVNESSADDESGFVASTADVSGTPEIGITLKENSVIDSNPVAVYSFYNTESRADGIKPSDSSAWTIADIDALQIGMNATLSGGVGSDTDLYNLPASNIPAGSTIKRVTTYLRSRTNPKATTNIRVTQVYAEVIYTPAFVNNVLYTDYVNLSVNNETVPPAISSIQNSSITTSGVTINWTTDEGSNSSVDYGINTSLGSSTGLDDNVTSHSINLTGLNSGILYYYNLTSCDVVGNCNSTGTYNFTTTAEAEVVLGGGGGSSDRFYQRPGGENLLFYLSLSSRNQKEIEVDDNFDFGIKTITIFASSFLSGNLEIVKKDKISQDCIPADDYVFYRGYEIIHDTMDNTGIEKAILRVGVSKEWFEENEITQIKAIKCGGGIDFNEIEDLDEEYIYNLESDGFSEWYVIGVKDVELLEEEISKSPILFEIPKFSSPEPETQQLGKIGLIVIFIIFLIALIFSYFELYKGFKALKRR